MAPATPLNVSDAAFARREAYINGLIEQADNIRAYLRTAEPGTWAYEIAASNLDRVKGSLERARAVLLRMQAQRFGFA